MNKQAIVPENLKLLHSGFVFGDLILDLYGTYDSMGWELIAVAPADTKIDITYALSVSCLKFCEAELERNAPSDEFFRQLARDEIRAAYASYLTV